MQSCKFAVTGPLLLSWCASGGNLWSRAPLNAVPFLYATLSPPIMVMQLKAVQVRPFPPSSIPQQGPVSPHTLICIVVRSLSTPSLQD